MNLRKYFSTVRDMDMDDYLGAVGLQRRSGGDWVFPMLAGLGAGMAIGAGLAFFLTPYRGEEARQKVMKGASDAQKMLSEKVSLLSDKVSSLVGEESPAATPATPRSMGGGIQASSSPTTGTTGNRSY